MPGICTRLLYLTIIYRRNCLIDFFSRNKIFTHLPLVKVIPDLRVRTLHILSSTVHVSNVSLPHFFFLLPVIAK